MTKRRAQKRTPTWGRPAGPQVSLLREGGRVWVDFVYTPARVKVVKGVKGARYNAADKSWSVPIEGIQAILESKEFPPTARLDGLAPVGVESTELKSNTVTPLPLAQARSAWSQNPFSVAEDVLAALSLQVVVRLNPLKHRIRVITRLNSEGDAQLQRTRAAVFSAFDGAYVLPSTEVGPLLKRLRNQKIPFAVDSVAGAALRDSAELRAQIVAAPAQFTARQLTQALLTPFIAKVLESDEPTFRPCYFTSEQFRLAFPGVKRGLNTPFLLNEQGLLQLIARLQALPFPIWMPADVAEFVEQRREQLLAKVGNFSGPVTDATLELLTLPLMWRRSSSGRASLVVNLEQGQLLREMILTQCAEILKSEIDTAARSVIVEIPDSKLLTVLAEVSHLCEVHGVPAIPKSESFVAFEHEQQQRTRLRERSAYYATLEDLAGVDVGGLTLAQSERLFPHQRIAVRWLLETPFAFLGDDMGLGKTLSVLSYFTALRAGHEFQLLLVVCPNSLTRNWMREATSWFPDLRATVLAGAKSEKAWALRLLTSGALEFDVVVVNYEAVRLPYVFTELEKLASQRRTLLCLDESQRVKNPQAKTFKTLVDLAPHCQRRVLLSGTPTPKDVSDLWAQMRILDGGERFGRSYYNWLTSVAELGNEYSEFAVKKFHDEEVRESILRVHEIMLRRRKERVVNLPEKTFSIREIELTGSQRERYDEIREGLILRMRANSGEQFVRDITNILEEYLRAVQVASNPRLIDPLWKGEPAKFLELDEIVHELVEEQGQKLVVWTNYLGNIRELTERYKRFGAAPFSGEVSAAEREVTVRAFQEQEHPKILVAVPAAGGVGITLTAAQTAVYLDKTWNAEHWMQSVDRIHRIGQRGTVNIISLLGCKVDEIIHWNLRRKERTQAQVLGDDVRASRIQAGSLPSRAELLEALEES